jgi:hypothetical protein
MRKFSEYEQIIIIRFFVEWLFLASIFFGPILFICVLPVWDRAEGKWVPIVATVVLILTAIIRPRVNARYEAYKRHFMKNRLEVASDEEDELTK